MGCRLGDWGVAMAMVAAVERWWLKLADASWSSSLLCFSLDPKNT